MKKRNFLLLAILLSMYMSCKKEEIKGDPTPRVIRTFILDKTTGKNLIGKNGEPYHPDSIKLIALKNPDFYSINEPMRIDADSGYYIQSMLVDLAFLFHLNKNEQDTMKFESDKTKISESQACGFWPPFKVYYKNQIVLDIKNGGELEKPSSSYFLTLILNK